MSGAPERHSFRSTTGIALSVLTWGSGGRTLLCLHGHFGQGAIYHRLPQVLPGWRVVALDQRGHGFSDHAATYRREDYLADAVACLDSLGISRAAVLGSSLGGVNAYQLAARAPQRVSALVIEDIGAVCRDDLSWCLGWPRRFPSLAAMRERIHPYFCDSAVEREDGWDFRFHREGMVASQQALNGDWWADWLGSRCPALLLRGGTSTILTADHAAEMVARRPGTAFRLFPGASHNINEADPAGFAATVADFLAGIPP